MTDDLRERVAHLIMHTSEEVVWATAMEAAQDILNEIEQD